MSFIADGLYGLFDFVHKIRYPKKLNLQEPKRIQKIQYVEAVFTAWTVFDMKCGLRVAGFGL
jgi:hypothetical protein